MEFVPASKGQYCLNIVYTLSVMRYLHDLQVVFFFFAAICCCFVSVFYILLCKSMLASDLWSFVLASLCLSYCHVLKYPDTIFFNFQNISCFKTHV